MRTWLVGVLVVLGCEGPAGPAGEMGAPGERGVPGEPGEPGAPLVDPALAPLDKAVVAIGGREALDALVHVEIEARGTRWMTLEGAHPEDGAHQISSFTVTGREDVASGRWRLDYAREIPFFGASTMFSEIVDIEHGAVAGTEHVFGFPGGAMLSDRLAATRKQQRLLNPHVLLRAALAEPARVRDAGLGVLDGGLHHLVEVADAAAPITLWIHQQTGRISKATTLENDYVRSDVAVEALYGTWRAADDGTLLFPRDVVLTLAAEPAHVEQRTAVRTGVALDPAVFVLPEGTADAPFVAADAARGERNHQFHESFAGFGLPMDGLQTTIDAELLAPGVYHVRGGSHHSLAIEQSAGVVIVEAPLNEARALAVLDWVDATFAGKPVTHLIATHHHRDHVGAFRTFIARGATLVVGEAAAPFFARAARAPRTIEPDELAAMPANPNILAVPAGRAITLDDATHPVVVQAIDTAHSIDMVVPILPRQEIAFDSDLYSPGFPAVPFFAAELYRGIAASGQPVSRIAGGHGVGVGTIGDLRTAAGLTE